MTEQKENVQSLPIGMTFTQETGASFWNFEKKPLFVGTFSGEFENKEADIKAFIFTDFFNPETEYLIPQNKAIADVVNKYKPKEREKLIFKIEFAGKKELKGGRSFNQYVIHTAQEQL